jgi:hypothetical protein
MISFMGGDQKPNRHQTGPGLKTVNENGGIYFKAFTQINRDRASRVRL